MAPYYRHRLLLRRCLLRCCFVLLPWLSVTSAIPYLMLYNAAAKCFQVDVPRLTTLELEYHAPDLVLEGDSEQARAVSSSAATGGESVSSMQRDGIDSRFNDRFRQQQILAARKIKDTSIVMYQRDVGSLGLVNPGDRKGTGRLRQQLEVRSGVLEFQTDPRDAGLLEVCVQSFSARHDAPTRISVLVRRKSESRIGGRGSGGAPEDVKKLSMLSNIISADLTRFEQRSKDLGANADQARDQEKEFHGQSIKLNRAVKYWPIFRMVVLVVGGYAQVTHVIRFMRSRHIF